MEQAAGQGHAYAMHCLGGMYRERKQHVLALEWYTKGAEAGLPGAMNSLGCRLDGGDGGAAPDYPAAAGWYRRAADAGNGDGANNLSLNVRSRPR
jgi:TPR repeat protein